MTTNAQVRPLLQLRWRMVRARSARAGLVVALLALPALIVTAVAVGALLPRADDTDGLLLITPSLLLGFFALSIVAPLGAGGGVELYPSEQVAAYPIRSRTIYYGALLMTPLNLAWLLQVIVALGLLTYISAGAMTGRLATTLTVLVYLAVVTLLGQAIAWTIVGIRRTRLGRIGTWLAVGVGVVGIIGLIRADRVTDALDQSPTRWVVIGALSGADGNWPAWVSRTVILAVVGIASLLVGRVACRWAVQRAGDGGGTREGQPVARRPLTRTASRTLMRMDLLGIWRAPALRRGALLLGILPGIAIAATRAEWTVLVLVPSLVCAGAALMFGINAFCLDASGAIWEASLPLPARTVFWTRTRTVVLVLSVPVLISVVAGVSRAPDPPGDSWVVAVAATSMACVARISATCMRWSVTRPHRADLRGPRDTPAPPGSMAAYALRLSLTASGIGLLMTLLAVFDDPLIPILGAAVIVLFSLRSLVATQLLFNDPHVRATVVATVSGG